MANFNIEVTIKVAEEQFSKIKSKEDIISRCGFIDHENGFIVKFIDRELLVTFPEGIITDLNTGEKIDDRDRIIILHYCSYNDGAPLVGNLISYKELPGGDIYINPFTGRCINYMIGVFSHNLDGFGKACEKCGGKKLSLGDISYTINVFPKLPITLVLRAADDEFPANGNILFDGSASHFLNTEDYAVVCGQLIGRLRKLV